MKYMCCYFLIGSYHFILFCFPILLGISYVCLMMRLFYLLLNSIALRMFLLPPHSLSAYAIHDVKHFKSSISCCTFNQPAYPHTIIAGIYHFFSVSPWGIEKVIYPKNLKWKYRLQNQFSLLQFGLGLLSSSECRHKFIVETQCRLLLYCYYWCVWLVKAKCSRLANIQLFSYYLYTCPSQFIVRILFVSWRSTLQVFICI